MMRFAVKDLRDGFTVAGSQRRNINESFDSMVGRSGNDCPGVGMSNEHDGSCGSFKSSGESCDVIGKRCQRNRSADHIKTQTAQRKDDGENGSRDSITIRSLSSGLA
jgi:hypothetical protein